jgi:hypothetical protein
VSVESKWEILRAEGAEEEEVKKEEREERKMHLITRIQRLELDLRRLGLGNDEDIGIFSFDVAREACRRRETGEKEGSGG